MQVNNIRTKGWKGDTSDGSEEYADKLELLPEERLTTMAREGDCQAFGELVARPSDLMATRNLICFWGRAITTITAYQGSVMNGRLPRLHR